MHAQSEEIRRFWNERAAEYGTDRRATLRETALRELEISAITRHLRNGTKVLDVGCGNGYSTIQFATRRNLDILGIDFSPRMIECADENLRQFKERKPNVSMIAFSQDDVLDLSFPEGSFDTVISERCLQNLVSWEDQRHAILNIARILRPQGHFVMAECSFTGLDHLARFLRLFGKKEPTGIVPWHNLFFCDDLLINDPLIRKQMVFVRTEDFASTYTVVTRLLPAFMHRIVSYLPSVGGLGYNKIFLWRKRE